MLVERTHARRTEEENVLWLFMKRCVMTMKFSKGESSWWTVRSASFVRTTRPIDCYLQSFVLAILIRSYLSQWNIFPREEKRTLCRVRTIERIRRRERQTTHIQTMIQQSNLKLTGALSSCSSQKQNRKTNTRRSAISEYQTRALLFALGRNATLGRQSMQMNESPWFLPIMHVNKFKKPTSTRRVSTSERNHPAIVRWLRRLSTIASKNNLSKTPIAIEPKRISASCNKSPTMWDSWRNNFIYPLQRTETTTPHRPFSVQRDLLRWVFLLHLFPS